MHLFIANDLQNDMQSINAQVHEFIYYLLCEDN